MLKQWPWGSHVHRNLKHLDIVFCTTWQAAPVARSCPRSPSSLTMNFKDPAETVPSLQVRTMSPLKPAAGTVPIVKGWETRTVQCTKRRDARDMGQQPRGKVKVRHTRKAITSLLCYALRKPLQSGLTRCPRTAK